MGFRDTFKKARETEKNAEWRMGAYPVIIELEENYMKLTVSTAENIIFYTDIMYLEQVNSVVRIKTNVKSYDLRTKKLRGGSKLAEELHLQILEKMHQSKQ